MTCTTTNEAICFANEIITVCCTVHQRQAFDADVVADDLVVELLLVKSSNVVEDVV